jgi:hypothetical protein
MPDAMPARAGSTTPTGAGQRHVDEPAPMPARMKPGTRCEKSSAGVIPRISSSATPMNAKPGPIR